MSNGPHGLFFDLEKDGAVRLFTPERDLAVDPIGKWTEAEVGDTHYIEIHLDTPRHGTALWRATQPWPARGATLMFPVNKTA
jgi:hypothetical protein